MTALADQLRLEVLASSVASNLVDNHSAQAGTTADWTRFSGTFADSTLTADSGLAWGYEGDAFKLTLGDTWVPYSGTKDYGSVTMRSDAIAVTGLQWVNVAATFRAPAGLARSVELDVRFYDASDTFLGVHGGDHGTFGGWDIDADNVVSFDTLTAGGVPLGPAQAPSGTAYMRIFISAGHTFKDPAAVDFAPTWVSRIMAITAASESLASGVIFSDEAESWQNVINAALTARVMRGGDVDGVTDKLDAGLMVATVKDPLLTPENNERIRPGRPIRLMGLNGDTWEPIFTGKLSFASTSYAGELPVVSLTATDAMADLENYPAALGKSGRFEQRVDAAMVNVPLAYTVTDTDSDTTQATISADQSGTALSQLVLIRDSLRGLFYVAKDNTLECFANNSYPSQTAAVEFSDDEIGEPDTLGYTAIETSFDSKNLVNTLTVTKNALSEPNGSKVYGPYLNQDSVDEWYSVSADLVVNDGDPADLAGAYLAVYDEPTIFAETLTYDASDDATSAIERELYEAVSVKFSKADLEAVYRVVGIEHLITPDKWTVILRFKPLESTSTIVVTDPPGGPDTGPADLVPFTREIQCGNKALTFSASNLVSGSVVFDKPYENDPPRVIVGSRHTSMFGSATSVTKTGFTLNLRLFTGTTSASTTADWVAIPE